jgi:hypothetical protein
MVQNCDLWYQPDSDNQWAFVGVLESFRFILTSLESGREKHKKWVAIMDRTCHLLLLPSERANHCDNELRGPTGCKEKDIKTLASQSAARRPQQRTPGASGCRSTTSCRMQIHVSGCRSAPLLASGHYCVARWPSSSPVSPHTLRKSLSSNKFNFQITGSDSGPIPILQ